MAPHWRYVKHLQEQARKDRDVIKLNCVNDKLVQMKPQMNMNDTARNALEQSGDLAFYLFLVGMEEGFLPHARAVAEFKTAVSV